MVTLSSLLIILGALSIVVFLHELGHMMMAKRAGVAVYEFAVGMGPKLFGFKRSETLYTIRLLPIGGFVKLAGMDGDPDCKSEDNFYNKPLKDRALTILAGPLMNLLLGYVIYAVIIFVMGASTVSSVIDTVIEGSPAQRSGLEKGDEIVSINGRNIESIIKDLILPIRQSPEGSQIQLTIKRGGQLETRTVMAQKMSEEDVSPKIGVSFVTSREPVSIGHALVGGAVQTVTIMGYIIEGIGQLIIGKANVEDLSGPVGLFQMASFELDRGWIFFLNIMAIISINLGLINLFPFPVLDGGHLLLMLIEFCRGKALSKRLEMSINQFGMLVLLSLMIFLVFNDIVNWDERVSFFNKLSSSK